MPEEPEPNFEDALARVERIVNDLERGEPSLSRALVKYEDGVKLLRHCYELLDRAERSVALLTGVDADGQPETAPFDAAATLAPPPTDDKTPRTQYRISASRSSADTPDPADPPF